jgi:hypothetical protein
VLWNGEGRRLTNIELLLLVSCSLGRVQETGERDVAGFCVQMALAHARSVLAARWPINARQAPEVANTILKHYLALREQHGGAHGGDLTAARLRGLAVAAAREEIVNNHGDKYLNTLAAFDLFGLA